MQRLHRVLDKRLSEADYLAGTGPSIADIATFPWVRNPDRRGINLDDYPAVKRWHDAIAARPAVQRGVAVLSEHQSRETMTGGGAGEHVRREAVREAIIHLRGRAPPQTQVV